MRPQARRRGFRHRSAQGRQQVKARVIGVIENQAPTRALERHLTVSQGLVDMDRGRMSARSRWSSATARTGEVTNGFVSGFGYKTDCAVASTVAHDSHHMIVVGTNKDDMAHAANTLRRSAAAASSW